MFWNKYFWPSILTMLVVVSLHWVASLEGLYWTISWYDIGMHFLGGLWVSFFLLWVFSMTPVSFSGKYVSSEKLLLFVLIIGVLWEAHEIILGFTDFADKEYWSDTNLDLIMDMIGASLGVFIYRKDIRKKLQA